MSDQRCSKDKSLNNEGNNLLEMCKCYNLCILNGRCGDDRNLGNFTFRNTSVIVYTIASAETLMHFRNFKIT